MLWVSLAGLAALAGATLARQLGGLDGLPTTSQPRWYASEVVVTLDESLQTLGPDAERALRAAFEAWRATGAPTPKVRFERGRGAEPKLTPDGINSVLIAPIDFEGHETDLAITIGFSHPSSGAITEADIVINARHAFTSVPEPPKTIVHDPEAAGTVQPRPLSCLGNTDTTACGQTYDLQNVLTHEVGHFWGLPEDFYDRSSTMYSCTSACEVHKRKLGETDVESLRKLYAASTGGCAHRLRAFTWVESLSALTAGVGLWGILWSSRRRRSPTRSRALRLAQPGTKTRTPNGGRRKRSDWGRP